ncbi:unnamed protein product [Effrenium voratum]|nr:unnamed protein product [Effrenium voratum]
MQEVAQVSWGAACVFFVRNLMFDESSFDLRVSTEPATVHSILCSHGQWTFAFPASAALPDNCGLQAGEVYDEDCFRAPQSMGAMNSQTMWLALTTGRGGLGPVAVAAKRVATLTTCDAHAANLRLLRHLDQALPTDHLFLPILCAQHRAGNVVEQLTKLLGNLGGCFCMSKVMNKRACLAGLRAQVGKVLEKTLQVWGRLPAGLHAEWAEGQRCARKLVGLCTAFLEDDSEEGHAAGEQGAGAQGGAHPQGRRRKSFEELLAFFPGPWTGSASVGQLAGVRQPELVGGELCGQLGRATGHEAVADLFGNLVTDSYGNVEAVKMARDAYNSHPMHMVWSSVTTGAEMWVGGAAASGDISTLTRNGISSHTTFAEAMTIAGLVISALLAGARVLSYARPEITPLQWLEQNYDKIYEVYSKTWSKYNFRLNNLLTPWEFLARAGELGFMAKAEPPKRTSLGQLKCHVKSGKLPRAAQRTPSSSDTFEVVSEASRVVSDSGMSSWDKVDEPSDVAEGNVPGSDSEFTRQNQFEKLQELIHGLAGMNEELLKLGGGEPGQPDDEAGQVRAELDQALGPVKEEVDWEPEDADMKADPVTADDVKASEKLADQLRSSQDEEMKRLYELLSEQKALLQRMADAKTEKDAQDELGAKLQEAILSNSAEALKIVQGLRLGQLETIRDANGMSPLHAAVKMLNTDLVWAIIEKCPGLVNVPSRTDRNPAHWTPLMTLCDMPKPADGDSRHFQIGTSLVHNMSRDALNNRASNWTTASHLATSRGSLHLLKKILYRLNDLGGKPAVMEHLSMVNAYAARTREFSFELCGHWPGGS